MIETDPSTPEAAMDGITCTSETCPCRSVRDEGPAIGSLINRQQDTDAIVFPLFAGTLARCVLATRPSTPPSSIDALMGTGLVDHARIILTLAQRVSDADGWERDREAFATVVNFVLAAWEVFPRWVPSHYVPIACRWDGASPGSLIGAARDWMRPDRERTLTELVLFTADVANRVASNKPVLPLDAKAVRPLRVEIAARLRARGLTTWPRVLEAAVADWNIAALERLMLDFAFDPLAISRDVLVSLGVDVGTLDDAFDDRMDDDELWDEPVPEPVATVPDAPPPRDAGLESMLTDALAEIDRGEARRQAVESERLKLADRCAGLQGRIERLTSDLSASRADTAEMEALVASLRRERDELADRLVAEEVLTGARPAPPADAFAGCRVCVFVGGPSGAVRDELAARCTALGAAEVSVYDIDRDRGPDAYPPHAIVILGVATMGHSASDYVLGRARASRVWYFRGGYGAGRLAAAAAAAYSARRAAARDREWSPVG
jgi:hypothetical protein